MAKPKPPPYPSSLIAEDIRALIGFGVKTDLTPPRYSHGGNPADWPSTGSSKIFNRTPTQRAFFEFEPLTRDHNRELELLDLDFERKVYVAHVRKQAITHIEEVHAADLADPDSVLQPIAPMVCSVHMFQTFDGAPLLVLMDEKYDRVILAIGNMGGKPIQFEPKQPRGYRPDWYVQMKVREDLPVYASEP